MKDKKPNTGGPARAEGPATKPVPAGPGALKAPPPAPSTRAALKASVSTAGQNTKAPAPSSVKAAPKRVPAPAGDRPGPAPAPAPVASKATEPAKPTDLSVSVHPAPQTPASEAEPGASALGSIAAVAGPASPPKKEESGASKTTSSTVGTARPAAQAPPAPAPLKTQVAATAEIVPMPKPSTSSPARSATTEPATKPVWNQNPAPPAPAIEAPQADRDESVGTASGPSVAPPGVATAASGLVELNTKMFDLFRAQNEAVLAAWRSAASASSLSEAIRIQTSGVRKAYEASAAQWKDIADTTGRLLHSMFPLPPK